ncbi:hypothetical protein SAMN05421637_1824 [Demequina mangrovi]|uniref:Uncharacterized protein n=2 Tax=Demequina mangrovi TaxID=1043493 RepID=A0A1H6Z1R0_9MICO|nr:hypothetical protein SAMN05421637_1824 [Demequina mangrovi]
MERTRLAAIAGWRATVGVGALVISATVLIVSEVSALGDYPDWLVAASRVLAGLGFVVGSVMVSGAVAAAEDLASVASSLSDLGGEGAAD